MAPFMTATYFVCMLAATSQALPNYHRSSNADHGSLAALEGNSPRGYRFAFSSDDVEANQKREEHSDEDGNVRGSYSFTLPDGTQRRVRYIADEAGFRAKIESNEHGLEAKNPADVKLMVSEKSSALNQGWAPAKQSWSENVRSEPAQRGWTPKSASVKQGRPARTVAINQGWSDESPRSQGQKEWSPKAAPIKQQGWSDQSTPSVQPQGWSDNVSAPQKAQWSSKSAPIRKASWPSKSARLNQGWSDDSAPTPIRQSGWTDETASAPLKQQQRWSSPKSSAFKSGWSDEETFAPVKAAYESDPWNQKRTTNINADWSDKSSGLRGHRSESGSRLERFTKDSGDGQTANVKLELPHTDKVEWFAPPPVRPAALMQQW